MKLVLENVSKSFKDNVVLENITYEFQNGSIYVLLGRNGVGKTTLFHCIDSTYKDRTGNIYLEKNGEKIPLNSKNLGYVLAEPRVPEFLTGYEFIRFFMEVQNIEEVNKIDEYFKMIHFEQKDAHKLIKEYSLGMKNKLQILMYLILKPDVLLLDEPLSSFDIIAAKEIKDILKKMKKDTVIFFSTHILELAQSIGDKIIILNNQTLEPLDKSILKEKNFEEKIVELLK